MKLLYWFGRVCAHLGQTYSLWLQDSSVTFTGCALFKCCHGNLVSTYILRLDFCEKRQNELVKALHGTSHVTHVLSQVRQCGSNILVCVSLLIPDDFAVLTGDVKLEHVSTLSALYELKGNLWREREGRSTLHSAKH